MTVSPLADSPRRGRSVERGLASHKSREILGCRESQEPEDFRIVVRTGWRLDKHGFLETVEFEADATLIATECAEAGQ